MIEHTYNKAVRDKIPEMIRAKGSYCNVITLSDDQFLAEIEKKLIEEVNEYNQEKSVEELADILEVILRIAELKGVSRERLEKIRKDKELARGRFQKNLFLIGTRSDQEK